jgi:hypothetical protein
MLACDKNNIHANNNHAKLVHLPDKHTHNSTKYTQNTFLYFLVTETPSESRPMYSWLLIGQTQNQGFPASTPSHAHMQASSPTPPKEPQQLFNQQFIDLRFNMLQIPMAAKINKSCQIHAQVLWISVTDKHVYFGSHFIKIPTHSQ